MEDMIRPPALPQHSDQLTQERVAEPVAKLGMLMLLAMLWAAALLVISPLWAGTGVGAPLVKQSIVFAPLPVATRLPQLLVADKETQSEIAESNAVSAWDDTRSTAGYVAGALVEDEVQGVLLKLQLLAETGKWIGRMAEQQ